MDEMKKLFQAKRIFAMILAAAMVITMMPATANAASVSDDTAAETQEVNEASADTETPDVTGGTAEESISPDTEGKSTDVWTFEDGRSDYQKTAVYGAPSGEAGQPGNPQDFRNGLSRIFIRKNGIMEVDGVFNYLDKEWQKKTGTGNEDKDYTALGRREKPTDAGEYRLVVTAPDGKTKGSFIFTITPYEPNVSLELDGIEPGTAKKDVKPESFISSLYFQNKDLDRIYFTATLEDDTITGYEPIPGTILVSVAQIKDTITAKPLDDADVLTKDQDYIVDITLTFKEDAAKIYGKNYKLPETVSKVVTISDLITPTVVADLGERDQLDADGKPVTDVDGKPIKEKITELERSYTGETVKEPERDKEYSVKIELDEQETGADGKPVVDKDGNPVMKTIPVTADNLTESWYRGYNKDSDSYINGANKLEGAPVEAGDYTYLLTYEGQKGVYAKAAAKIHVVVNKAELTIVPKFTEGAKFYPGMTVKQALAQVDYTVLDAEKKSFDENVDRNSFWGTYTSEYATLPYEPVFGIQVKERTEELVNDDGTPAGTADIYGDGTGYGTGYLSANTILQAGQTYRVVFTGQKAVYYSSGNVSDTKNINADVKGHNYNTSYHVADGTNGDKTNEENAAAITLEAGTLAVIHSNLTKEGGVGESYDKPIPKVYDGKRLFDRKADYKLATVIAGDKKIAERTNQAITYTWEREDEEHPIPVVDADGNPVLDKDGNQVYEPNWIARDYDGNDLSNLGSPVNAGKYRLTIFYADAKNDKDGRGYYAEPEEVYYEIAAQNVILVPDEPENGYSVPVGYTVSQFLNSLADSAELDETGELPHKVFKLDEKLEYEPEALLNWLYGLIDINTGEAMYWHPYGIDWGAAKKDEKGQWVMMDSSDVFEAGGTYGLRAKSWDFYLNDEFDDYRNNYRTYMDAGVNDAGEKLVIYFADPAPVKLTAQGTAELDVELDTSKITAKTKEYDGTPISVLDEVKKNLLVYKKDDAGKTPVTDVINDMQFVWKDKNGGRLATEPVNGGTYRLYAKFMGNASYKAFDSDDFCINTGLSVTITPKNLTVVPAVKEPVVAGKVNEDLSNYCDWANTEFKGFAAEDEGVFTYSPAVGFPAVTSKPIIWIYDAAGKWINSNPNIDSRFKGDADYTLGFSSINLSPPYDQNYKLRYEKVSFRTVRGYSSVEGTSYGSIPSYEIQDSITDVEGTGTHTITVDKGIAYQYGKYYNSSTGKYESGNFISMYIYLPEEYRNFSEAEAVYANSIESAGGYVLNKSSIESNPLKNSYIKVLFNAEDGKEQPIAFDICWEVGYVEHFILDFTEADLLEDLRNAVAPKSISLNKPEKKMTIGGTQDLDVKLKTSQIGDLIHLSYTVDKPDVLCVTTKGEVTALSEGSATITVEATKRDENGEYVSTTPVKKTSVKIKVSKVTAPKIKKIDNVSDGKARILWAPLNENDGFRREIYVLEGKTNYTKDEFERKIASMKNGSWQDIFAMAPVYTTGNYDIKAKANYYTISGLAPDKEYTVYVRNVNSVRTINNCGHDNCTVAESHDGNVKGFKTTKGQVTNLSVAFLDENVTEYISKNDLTTHYMVALKEGKTTATVYGNFYEWIDAAGDYSVKTLPLSKDDRKIYVNPKLEYMVGTLEILKYHYPEKAGYIGEGYGYDREDKYGYYYYYLDKTPLASVNNKGALKLNGAGEVDVVVRDKTTGVLAYNTLEIVAAADSIAKKNVKMQVGQRIWVGNLLTYKEGKKVLIGAYDRKVVIDDAVREAISKNESFELSEDENYLIAVKPGRLKLTLRDAYVGEDQTAEVTLNATALEPIKNLKATNVTDNYFNIEFTHSLTSSPIGKDGQHYSEYYGGLGFRIKVTDARGTLLRSEYVSAEDLSSDDGTNKYMYDMAGLTKKSKYNVTVTAEFRKEASKETKKPVKTTLLPASYIVLDKDDMNEGIGVYVHGESNTINRAKFYTGNSYSLKVGGPNFNPGAKVAMTDTLIWTSSNSKVATVKANRGSYSASLKAAGQGSTVIELRSKITKAVIARYMIEVKPIGNAYFYPDSPIFYGDDEKLEIAGYSVYEIMGYAFRNGSAPIN